MYTCHGNRLVDESGKAAVIKAVSWFGVETRRGLLGGLEFRDERELLRLVKAWGFNALRIPYSNWMLTQPAAIGGELATTGPNFRLAALSPLARLDDLMEEAARAGLGIILDRHCHRPSVENGDTWVSWDQEVGEDSWISDWVRLAERYRDASAFVGCDLHNEPHTQAVDPADWSRAAGRCGRAILDANAAPFIIVQGTEVVGSDWYWWGGNLKWVRSHPVDLGGRPKLVYSPHEYGPGVHEQGWFRGSDYLDSLPFVWEEHWGFIHTLGIAPIIVGEFGARTADPTTREGAWLQAMVEHIAARGLSFAYWSLNPESHDTGGLLKNDWRSEEAAKLELLKTVLSPSAGDERRES